MNFETPHITLNYSTGDDGLDFRIELFERFEDLSRRLPCFFLTFGAVPRGQKHSRSKAVRVKPHQIKAGEIQEIVALIRKVRVPLGYPLGPIVLGPSNELIIQNGDLSTATFHWSELPRGWEQLAEVAERIKQLKFLYTGSYV